MNSFGKATAALALLAGIGFLLPQPAQAQKTYIAVGDSVAYGYQNGALTPEGQPDTSHPGYVLPFASDLQAQNGGIAYNVINLGIVGETTASLLNTTDTAAQNLNYTSAQTQAGLLHDDILSQQNASNTIGVITIQVGANDVLQTVGSTAFLFGTAQQRQALVNTTITQVGQNYTTLLTQIQQDEKTASLSNVKVLGYYNPYAGITTQEIASDPSGAYATLKAISGPLTQQLNAEIALEASQFGATYVDLYDPFLGHEAADTRVGELLNVPGIAIAVPNNHPNDAGYALIAQTLAAPEPPALAGLALGALGLAGITLRARRRRA